MNILYGFLSFIFSVIEFSVAPHTTAEARGRGDKCICTIQNDYVSHRFLLGFFFFFSVKINIIINILSPIKELAVEGIWRNTVLRQ